MSRELDLLIKGRTAEIGEERTWNDGKKYKKTANGWIAVSEGGKSSKKEDPSPKRKSDDKSSEGKNGYTKTEDGWIKRHKNEASTNKSSESDKDEKGPTKYNTKKKIVQAKKQMQTFVKQNREMFDTGEHAHPERSKTAKFLRAKGKGLVKGLKHEIHHIKDAGSAIKGLMQGKKPTEHQKKALKKVGITLGLTVASMAVTGGVGGMFAKGGVVFAKKLALHFVEHVIIETGILSAIFSKGQDISELSDEDLQKLVDAFINYVEMGDLSDFADQIIGEEQQDIEKAYSQQFKILGA